jgi:hypothetical protein
MTATVALKLVFGSGPTINTCTSFRYCTADVEAPTETQYPNQIPTTPETLSRSFWRTRCLYISGGTFSMCTNFRWGGPNGGIKSTWGLGSGKVQVGRRDSGDHGCPLASYDQAMGVVGEYGYDLKDETNGHTYYNGQAIAAGDMDDYTRANPFVFDSQVIEDDDAPAYTKCIVSQLVLADDSEQGIKSVVYEFVQWSEI